MPTVNPVKLKPKKKVDKDPPLTRKQYWIRQTLFIGYMLLWFLAWYLVMKSGSALGVFVQVILFLVFLLTEPTGLPFEPYEKAMKRMAKMKGYNGGPQAGGEAGDTNADRTTGGTGRPTG